MDVIFKREGVVKGEKCFLSDCCVLGVGVVFIVGFMCVGCESRYCYFYDICEDIGVLGDLVICLRY